MGSFEDRKATGTVFNIQKYSVHDGPGIRTIVLKLTAILDYKSNKNKDYLSQINQLK